MRKMIVGWLRRTSRAFTLIELLVVIAIIGILAGMLLPALAKAREKANNARSVSNLHQWALAINMYNDDWTEYYPYDGAPQSPCASGNTNAWFNVLPPYVGQKTLCTLYSIGAPPTPRENSVWVDPSATNKSVNPTMGSPVFYYAMSSCLHEESSTRRWIPARPDDGSGQHDCLLRGTGRQLLRDEWPVRHGDATFRWIQLCYG